MARQFSPKHILLFLAVPALAIFIAGRQLYLSTYHNLSTWKGGGMGMFASADFLSRYVRVFIDMPDGQRIVIKDLTPKQVELLNIAKLYPTDGNFAKLGNSLRRTRFEASREPSFVHRFDRSGNSLGVSNNSYIVAAARDDNSSGTELDLPLVLELWELSYDPESRLLKTSVRKSMRLGPAETREKAPGASTIPKL